MSEAYTKIEIPYGNEGLVLEVDLLLQEPSEIIKVLIDQNSNISYWIQVAIGYYRQGKDDLFESVMTECLNYWSNPSNNYPECDKDKARALDLLAIFYVRKGYTAKNRERRRDYFARAAQKFTEVDRSELINITNQGSGYQFHLLGRAYNCLAEGRLEQADQQFTFVLQQQQNSGQPDNVPSLLGRAYIEYNKKDNSGKRAALALYKKALQVCPKCPADVRLGLGICFYRLNMIEKAELAFSRALAVDPMCVGALAGLGVIEINKKTSDHIKRGMGYVTRAYKINSSDPMVLILLADHFFYTNDFDKVIKLATRAMEVTENEAAQAQACYQLARAFHRQREYDNAFEYYYKATTFGGSQFFLAHYGLGQMYIQRGEFESAISTFETVLKTNPDNHETLKILASLYARSNSQTKKDLAKSYLEKVTKMRPDDVEAWVELASLTEQYDTPTALNAYKTSISLYESNKKPILPELYNNLAALLFSLNQLDEAEKFYGMAENRCKELKDENKHKDENKLHYESISYTIMYNMGRLYEAKHLLKKAEDIYEKIIYKHPRYIECYLRLGCMERDKGLLFNASDMFKRTFMIDPENFEAWTLIANLHLSKLELTPCQKKFDRILERTKLNPDVYSLVSVGNVWLLSQFQPQIVDKEKQRFRAFSFYKHALRFDPKNIYAANGIGCIFAVKGMFSEARDVFSQVREATADFPDVWVNIAHVYVEQQQYVAAVQMYENCLKKFYNNANVDILLYIARALFKANKLVDCKKALLRARYIEPNDLAVLFNLAKLLKTLARQIFEDRKSSYQAVITAEYELKLAKSYFRYYIDNKERIKTENNTNRNAIDFNKVNAEEQDCADLLLQVEKSIKTDAERRDREELERRREHEEQLELEKSKKELEKQKKLEEEKAKKEEIENKRRELLKKQEEAKKMLQEDKGFVNDDASGDEESGKKRKKKSKEGSSKKKEKTDRDQEREKEKEKNDTKKYKSRAILSSDSDSSDNEDE